MLEITGEDGGIPKDTPPNTIPCPASAVSLLLPHHPPKDGVVQVTLVCEAYVLGVVAMSVGCVAAAPNPLEGTPHQAQGGVVRAEVAPTPTPPPPPLTPLLLLLLLPNPPAVVMVTVVPPVEGAKGG